MNIVVGIQFATFVILSVLFWRSGVYNLSVAQAAYAVATIALFATKP